MTPNELPDPADPAGLPPASGLPVGEPGSAPGERPASAAIRKARSLGRGYLLVIAMALVALGGLYLLSEWRGPEKASAEVRTAELQVDDALARLGGHGPGGEHTDVKALVDGFYSQAKERQVPAGALSRNPFVYHPVRVAPLPIVKPPKKSTPSQVEAAQEARDALKEVRKLRLHVVLIGPTQRSAIISNDLLTVGQKIAGWTVTQIEPKRVVLKYKEYTHELKLPK